VVRFLEVVVELVVGEVVVEVVAVLMAVVVVLELVLFSLSYAFCSFYVCQSISSSSQTFLPYQGLYHF
jgi:hypothetical protein